LQPAPSGGFFIKHDDFETIFLRQVMLAVYQKDFLCAALAVAALKFGDFTLKSGRQSPYFFNAGAFATGEALTVMARAYAATVLRLREEGVAFDALYGPAYKGIPLVAGKLFIKTLRYTGGAKCYVLGHHAYPASYTFPERKKATCSENRFMYHYNKRKEDKRLQTWGATFAWLDESLKAIKRIFKKSALASITEPLIVFQAEKDDTVELAGQTFFAEQVPSAQLALCLNANHELYNGTNETLNRWYPELFRFYAAHSG